MKTLNKDMLENQLDELRLEYTKTDAAGDFIYLVKLDSIALFKDIKDAVCIFYYYQETKSLLAFCPNVYSLKENDSKLSVLSAINKANCKLFGGTVTLEDDGSAIYRRIERFDRLDSITKEVLNAIINDILASILYVSEEIGRIRKNEE